MRDPRGRVDGQGNPQSLTAAELDPVQQAPDGSLGVEKDMILRNSKRRLP